MKDHFRLLVVGGGTAGCSIASKFARILSPSHLAVVEPCEKHYYQPGYTLVGAGIMHMEDIVRKEQDVLPKGVAWYRHTVDKFEPMDNRIVLRDGQSLSYDYLVISTGLQLRFDMISGITAQAMEDQYSGLCSIYHPKYAVKTFEELTRFQPTTQSNAIFTSPNTPIKCPGAPKKFAISQRKCGEKQAKGRTQHLTKVDVLNRLATFDCLDEKADKNGETREFQYSLLHIAPPCSPIKALRDYAETMQTRKEPCLTDAKGWVAVNGQTLQSTAFANVFAFGDCTNTANSKTAAAISSQFKALKLNLQSAMESRPLQAYYDGYGSCPLVVDSKHVIMAEFNSQGPLETFPYDQSKPSRLSFLMKRYFMPFLYWNFLVRGFWNGPATFRKIFHFPSTIANH
uniref:FAD/NAD(P)-binding domain-containing protein n=1 Tax=Ditylenchus dipsaci TaxID=166011 RepID=A0A915EU48_9BILA